MRVNVKVRSATFEIECGIAGTTRVLWLAVQAKQRYAQYYELDSESLTPVDVCNQAGIPIWPHDLLADNVKPGDVLSVSIRDWGLSATDSIEPSLWEKMAAIEPKDYVSVFLVLDLRRFEDPDVFDEIENSFRQKEQADEDNDLDQKMNEPVSHHAEIKTKIAQPAEPKPKMVSVVGNFTNWRLSVPMVESDAPDLYSAQLMMPPGAFLLFRFNVDERSMVSEAHQIMVDSRGFRLNVIGVPGDPNRQSNEISRHFKLVSNPCLDLVKLGYLGLGEYAKTQLEISVVRRQQFNQDWSQVNTRALVQTAETYRALKDALWLLYPFVVSVFELHSEKQSSDQAALMNMMQFWRLCQKCQLPSAKTPLYEITRMFFNLNGPIPTATVIPAHPDNRITRPQFIEGFTRIAMSKFSQLTPADALKNFVAYYLKPRALKPLEAGLFRSRLTEAPVQQIFSKMHQPLLALFEKSASRKESASQFMFGIGYLEFKNLLTEYGIKTEGRASKQTSMLFMCTQDETEVEESPGFQMVFGEFLEALARLADIRYRENLPLDCKLSRLFDEVFFRKAIPSTSQ